MKLLPILLLNIVTVTLALVVYSQIAGDAALTDSGDASAVVDTSALESRLEALESERRKSRHTRGKTDATVLDRLKALEAATGARDAGAVPSDATEAEEDDDRVASDERRPPPRHLDELTDDDVQRFRDLQVAVRLQDVEKKNRTRVAAALTKLALGLSGQQEAKVHRAFAAFQPQVTRIWDEAKKEARATQQAGGQVDRGEIIATTTAKIETEFATTLDGVVTPGDAAAIAASLLSRGK